jgi:hypothetical protein
MPLLNRILDWLLHFFEGEIVLVEQGMERSLPDISGIKHVLYKKDGPFNRCACLNLGARVARYDILLFSDCDILLFPVNILNSAKKLTQYDVVKPFRVLLEIDYGPGRLASFAGGSVMFKRGIFESIGGWDTRFLGWGGEDNAMDIVLNSMFNTYILPDSYAIHIAHPRQPIDNEIYKSNCKLLEEYAMFSPGDIKKLCLKRSEIWRIRNDRQNTEYE